jgi:hypothetical protein
MGGRVPFLLTPVLIVLASDSCAGEETLQFEIRRASSNIPGKLVAFVSDREVNLSTSAMKAWTGWHPRILLYTERRQDGQYDFNIYNSITGGRKTLTTERLPVDDVTVARLENGEYTLVLFLGGADRREIALAHPESGVFRRIPNADAVAILNDAIEVRRGRSADRIPLSRSGASLK